MILFSEILVIIAITVTSVFSVNTDLMCQISEQLIECHKLLNNQTSPSTQLKPILDAIDAQNAEIKKIGEKLKDLKIIKDAVTEHKKKLKEIRDILENLQEEVKKIGHNNGKPPSPDDIMIGCESAKHNGPYIVRSSHEINAAVIHAFCVKIPLGVHDLPNDNLNAWTVVLSRTNCDIDFYRNWESYMAGFGNLTGDHWIGLKNLHELTSARRHELLIELVAWDKVTRYAYYDNFAVDCELDGFSLRQLGRYYGTAGDSLKHQVGMKFSTFDVDNDASDDVDCAKARHGAWWYGIRTDSNLAGEYYEDGWVPSDATLSGIYWKTFRGMDYSMKTARMLIRAVYD